MAAAAESCATSHDVLRDVFAAAALVLLDNIMFDWGRHRKVLIPLNTRGAGASTGSGQHWSLLVYDCVNWPVDDASASVPDVRALHYDSAGQLNYARAQEMHAFILKLVRDGMLEPMACNNDVVQAWSVQQSDSHSCGFFVGLNAYLVMTHDDDVFRDVTFDPRHARQCLKELRDHLLSTKGRETTVDGRLLAVAQANEGSSVGNTPEERHAEDVARKAATEKRVAQENEARREIAERVIDAKETVQHAVRRVKAYEGAAIMVQARSEASPGNAHLQVELRRIQDSLAGAMAAARSARRIRDDILDEERALIARHKAAAHEDARTAKLLLTARKALDTAASQEHRRAALGKTIGGPLAHMGPVLQADEEVVMAAVRRDGAALMHAHPTLACNKAIVMAAVENKGESIRFASEDLKCDKEIALAALGSGRLASQRTPSSAERSAKRQVNLPGNVPPLPGTHPSADVCLSSANIAWRRYTSG